MFTLEQVHEHSFINTNIVEYSPKSKPELHTSYVLSRMDRWQRARVCENLVAEHLCTLGYVTEVQPHNSSHDVGLYHTSGYKHIEVKSSLQNKNGRYSFTNFDHNKFHYLFLVFITPDHGVHVKWTDDIAAASYSMFYEDAGRGVNVRYYLDPDNNFRTFDITNKPFKSLLNVRNIEANIEEGANPESFMSDLDNNK